MACVGCFQGGIYLILIVNSKPTDLRFEPQLLLLAKRYSQAEDNDKQKY